MCVMFSSEYVQQDNVRYVSSEYVQQDNVRYVLIWVFETG